jgi:Uncharacterized conserved protein
LRARAAALASRYVVAETNRRGFEGCDAGQERRPVERFAVAQSRTQEAAIEKVGADGELNDPDAVAVIRKQVKQRQDSIESFEKGGRADLAGEGKSRDRSAERLSSAGDERSGITKDGR